jgi:transcriptional regulator with XRE-family HTH domain
MAAARDPVSRKLGARIRWLREDRGLSPEKLAAAVHVTPPTLARWERGEGRVFVVHLVALAKALRCEIRDFFTDRTRRTPNSPWCMSSSLTS